MAKKRKKKTYNTPKKEKHKHVNQSLNILKIMENPRCKGCLNILAKHVDRYTCSHCNNSIYLEDLK